MREAEVLRMACLLWAALVGEMSKQWAILRSRLVGELVILCADHAQACVHSQATDEEVVVVSEDEDDDVDTDGDDIRLRQQAANARRVSGRRRRRSAARADGATAGNADAMPARRFVSLLNTRLTVLASESRPCLHRGVLEAHITV